MNKQDLVSAMSEKSGLPKKVSEFEINDIVKNIDEYIEKYNDKISETNAKSAIKDFDCTWNKITKYDLDWYSPSNHQSKYGTTLVIYSVAVHDLTNKTKENIRCLSQLIEEFDNDKDVENQYSIKMILYLNLGLCWQKLGKYEKKAVSAFKKYLYYELRLSNNTSFVGISAFGFRKCDKYLYKSLKKEQLNLSSPSVFNDPYDCPVLSLLNLYGDETSKLILKAYNEGLKIACFSRNIKLYPETRTELSQEEKEKGYNIDSLDNTTLLDEKGNPVYEKKNKDEDADILNPLMWAHYADSHRGICIKYHFKREMTKKEEVVSYFRDVMYSDENLSKYTKADAIPLDRAFFLKGKSWEYENELRYLEFDIDGKGTHKQVNISNCIEEIYFGLKCKQKDIEKVKKILKGKKWNRIIPKNVITGSEEQCEECEIKFYQMEMDKKQFGRLKAKELL